MPYSFVFVGRDPAGVTDSLGVLQIAAERIAPGDSVFVANVGETPVGQLFDEEARRRGALSFTIHDIYSSARLDQAVAQAPDMEDFFRRHTKNEILLYKNGTLTASFTAEITPYGLPPRRFTGTFTVRNEVWSKDFDRMYQHGYFHHPIQFVTDADTTGYSRLLDWHVRLALRAATDWGAEFMARYRRNKYGRSDSNYRLHFSVSERGDSTIKFKIALSPTKDWVPWQVLLTIDEKEKTLIHSLVKQISPSGEGDKVVEISTDHQYFREKKNSSPILFFNRVTYHHESWEHLPDARAKYGDRAEVEIDDVVFKVGK